MTDIANELSVSRYIDAKSDKVWQVLAERQEEWWCPKPWRVEINEQDRRPGGIWQIAPEGDGTRYTASADQLKALCEGAAA